MSPGVVNSGLTNLSATHFSLPPAFEGLVLRQYCFPSGRRHREKM